MATHAPPDRHAARPFWPFAVSTLSLIRDPAIRTDTDEAFNETVRRRVEPEFPMLSPTFRSSGF
jgi:hypothetical protein